MIPSHDRRARLRIAAQVTLRQLTDRGARLYVRERDAPQLLPGLFANAEPISHDIVTALRSALRRERHLGATGHWSYDPLRHIRLAQALAAESGAPGQSLPAGRAPETKNAAQTGRRLIIAHSGLQYPATINPPLAAVN